MVRVCPHSDGLCPNGMACAFSCATDQYDGTKRPMTPTPQPQEAHCQACGSEIQGWICQGCGLPFLERDGRLIVDVAAMSTREAEAPVSEVVAWARRWYIDGETPAKVRKDNGRMAWPTKFTYHEVTKGKCFSDDVALFGHPAPSPASAWKPIETAPKDGYILFTGHRGKAIDVGHWGSTTYDRSAKRYRQGWTASPGSVSNPTHWMPLPTPPATEGAGE